MGESFSGIAISDADRSAGGLTTANLALAVDIMRADGVLVLEQAVDLDHIRRLRERMVADIDRVLARADAPFNFNRGNLQQSPPRERDLLFRDVLLNDAAIAVTAALMGPGLGTAAYTGNTALARSEERQPVHVDWAQLWPGLDVAPPAHAVVLNIPVVDMDAENGSTELWLGTHRDTTVVRGMDVRIPAAALERRRAVRPPIQPAIPAGSIVLRDVRLWHAGMPNRSAQPRPMIAVTHMAAFYSRGPNDSPVFPAWAKLLLEHPLLSTWATWVDEEEVDHTRFDHPYGYTPAAAAATTGGTGPVKASNRA